MGLAPASRVKASAKSSTADQPWTERQFLNMVHAGGENEAPANTMYAPGGLLRTANSMILEAGARR
jgi:glycerophosphoryl diester phosphodiesterase